MVRIELASAAQIFSSAFAPVRFCQRYNKFGDFETYATFIGSEFSIAFDEVVRSSKARQYVATT